MMRGRKREKEKKKWILYKRKTTLMRHMSFVFETLMTVQNKYQSQVFRTLPKIRKMHWLPLFVCYFFWYVYERYVTGDSVNDNKRLKRAQIHSRQKSHHFLSFALYLNVPTLAFIFVHLLMLLFKTWSNVLL